MANQPINLGTAPTGDDGDTVRQAFTKVNANADELYAASDAAATKLATIATGATANATDAQLRDRATHTGTQAISTVSGLQVALDGKQPSNANLTAFAGLTGTADRLPYFTGAGALSLTTLTELARNLLDDTTQSGMQSTLGLVKQTSPTDTTAGALMVVGAFGLGGIDLPFLGSIDDRLARPGLYVCFGAATAPSQHGIVHIVSRATGEGSSAWVHQVFYDTINNGDVYERYSTNLAPWSPWRRMYHTGNILGTVSQSGGVPTGAIIERGSNANGEYVRWADGTQVCWNEGPTPYTTNLAASSLFYNNGQDFTYPAAFSGVKPPAVSAVNRRIEGAVFGFTYAASNTAVWVGAYSPDNISAFYAAYIAIGRWFP